MRPRPQPTGPRPHPPNGLRLAVMMMTRGRYVRMRQESLIEGATFGFTSARTLLAILRLSQALARLRCSEEVNRDHPPLPPSYGTPHPPTYGTPSSRPALC